LTTSLEESLIELLLLPTRTTLLDQRLRYRKQEKHTENLKRYYQIEYGVGTGGTPKNSSDDRRAVVEQNMQGEQCAIDVYKRLLDTTRDKDEVTWKMVLEILDDEVEHEADLQTILEDIDMMKKL